MTFKNAQERYEETKRNQELVLQEKENALIEFWQSELGEFLINEIERDITLKSEQGLFEVQINYSTIWNRSNLVLPIRTMPSSKCIIYDLVAMYEKKGFEVEILDGLMPRLIIKWDRQEVEELRANGIAPEEMFEKIEVDELN